MSTIVLCEDDDLMRSLLTEWLVAEGYQVQPMLPEAETASEVKLVVASVYMPKRDGAEVVRKARAAHPQACLLALSGQFSANLPATGSAARALGADRVLAKPLQRRAFIEAVRAMIGTPT